MIAAKHFSPNRQQSASFRFGLGIFSSVIKSDFQTVPSLQGIGMLRAQNSLSFLEHHAKRALGIAILTLIIKHKCDGELYARPFQRITGAVGELLPIAQAH